MPNKFKVGHSASESETLMPAFERDRTNPNFFRVFADIAGLADTRGEMIQFVNCLVNKYIFNLAGSITFLLPMTCT